MAQKREENRNKKKIVNAGWLGMVGALMGWVVPGGWFLGGPGWVGGWMVGCSSATALRHRYFAAAFDFRAEKVSCARKKFRRFVDVVAS